MSIKNFSLVAFIELLYNILKQQPETCSTIGVKGYKLVSIYSVTVFIANLFYKLSHTVRVNLHVERCSWFMASFRDFV